MEKSLRILTLCAISIGCTRAIQVPVYNQGYGFIVYPLNNTVGNNNTEPYGVNGCKSNTVNSTLSHHLFLGCVKRTDKLLFVQVNKLIIS